MLLCHSPVGELSMTRKHWRKMRCRCGNCINIPLQCRCCWGAQAVNLTAPAQSMHTSKCQSYLPFVSGHLPPQNSLSNVLASSLVILHGCSTSGRDHRGHCNLRGAWICASVMSCLSGACLCIFRKPRVKKVFPHKLIVTSKLPWWKNCYVMQFQ